MFGLCTYHTDSFLYLSKVVAENFALVMWDIKQGKAEDRLIAVVLWQPLWLDSHAVQPGIIKSQLLATSVHACPCVFYVLGAARKSLRLFIFVAL